MSKPSSKVGFGGPSSKKSACSVEAPSAACRKSKVGGAGAAGKKGKFKMPALSVPPKTPPLDPFLERLKRKTMRRNAPAGEDIKKIKEIIKGLQREPCSVQEYVGLVSLYTGDNGNVLHTAMGEDLSSFRKMAKRVYDTMTQDVSDVLANEQINLTEYYKERYTLSMDKMMRTINEIFRYAPDFDFDQYYDDKQAYLAKLFPISPDLEMDPEEEEMQRRQEAYHRLQWLRSEGTRLHEENVRLQSRLKQLKRQQQEELMAVRKQEETAEVQKSQLEATQADLHDQLQDLNESIEKSLISTEEQLRLADESDLKGKAARRQSHKTARARAQSQPRPDMPWCVKTAQKLEAERFANNVSSAISSVSLVSTHSKGGGKRKTGSKSTKPTKRDASPFHYSPVKTPPQAQPREGSPFHYSPPRTPTDQFSPNRSTARGGPSNTVRVESTSTITEEVPSHGRCPAARRNLAPRDSWGGFG